ncbi:MAG TPA: acetate--CoA ligase family protein [Actinomycetota bacterium]|nr:acetate--CoA ligase family protein [Actinomycetota bacterium]
MLEARTVAVVGASVREGSVGHQSLVELVEGGFDGRILPVNPKYDEVLGMPAFPSVAEIGAPVDLVILAVSNARLEEQLRLAAEAGAGSAVIFASGYEAPREGVAPLTERLAEIAREAGMAVCGGNGMGFANLEGRVRALGFYEPKGVEAGGVTFLSHSGSAFSAMLHNDRGLRLNLAVSTGQELVTTVADYMAYALGRESTTVIGLFIETIRDPAGFRHAMRLAHERDVPVVALKVGREALTRKMVTAHSGALAGEDGAYEALFEADGVLRVESLDELGDALALFASGRRAGPGGLASVHDSGGERALLVDSAAAVGVSLARISEATAARMAELLDEGLDPVNPLDFWGTGRDATEVVTGCIRALLDDPEVAALAFAVDLTTEDSPDMGYIAMAKETFPETDKPYAMLSNFSSGIDRGDVALLEEGGIPVLEGTLTGLAAFRHLFAYRDHRALPPVSGSSRVDADVRERWRARLGSGEPFDELEGLALLAAYGIPVVQSARVDTLEDAIAAAERIGFPVAMKTAVPGVLHKSDVGGVRLGIDDSPSLEDAYADLERDLGPQVVVAEMAPRGTEVALGVVRDPQFGPLVLVAAGGVLVEVLGDRRLALPPLDDARARWLVDRLRIRPLLDGVRGAPPGDVAALARAIVALSWLAHDLGEHLEALDANPVICGPDGCVAVDALVLPREAEG